MSKVIGALPKIWPFSKLPGYRESSKGATYSGFSYDALPSVTVDEHFAWLKNEPVQHEWSLRDWNGTVAVDLQKIEAAAGFALPPSFLTFLRSPDLHARIRSCTACYLELPEFVVPTAGAEEGHFIHFLSDQQWCLHWSLYLSATGEQCVICSEEAYGFEADDQNAPDNQSKDQMQAIDLIKEGVAFCAPSFSEFLYRFWIENEIWYNLNEGVPLTPIQQSYVDHYTG